MENIRAYTVIHNLKEFAEDIRFFPEDIRDNDDSVKVIRKQKFIVYLRCSKSYEEIYEFFMQTIFLEELEVTQLDEGEAAAAIVGKDKAFIQAAPIKFPQLVNNEGTEKKSTTISSSQSFISVNVAKLDKLMDLVGEMVISEVMVTSKSRSQGA
jgi:Chemotaxis protein histidine kinase and related kinases